MADFFGPITPGQKARRLEALATEAAEILRTGGIETIKHVSIDFLPQVSAILLTSVPSTESSLDDLVLYLEETWPDAPAELFDEADRIRKRREREKESATVSGDADPATVSDVSIDN